MPGEWGTVELGRLVEPERGISYGIVQPGAPEVGGVPIVRVSDIRDGRISTTDPLRVSPAIEEKHSRTRLKGGELLLTLVGTVGETAVVPESLAGWNTARAVAVIPVRKDVGSYWVRLAMQAPAVRQVIDSRLNTTVQATLNLRDVAQIPITVPPQHEREGIAHVLGTLDDKIEVNRRLGETLEAMARAIFTSWFVDFDPVRAKASGEAPAAICRRLRLTPDILALFPDRFQDSELGEIPEGWEVTTLRDVTRKIGSGATPRGGREVYLDHGVALIRSQNVYDSQFVWDGLARISDEAASQLSNVEVRRDDVLINITGASILRTCVVDPEVLPARVNQHVAIVRAREGVPARFVHLHLLQPGTKAYLLGLNAGGSREAITKAHLESVPIIRPAAELLAQFQRIVSDVYSQSEVLTSQARVLACARDTLLPKLISGELRVAIDGLASINGQEETSC